MKFVSLPPIKAANLYLFSFIFVTVLMLSPAALSQTDPPSQASLSLADILIGLRSKKVTLPERNKLLTDAVRQRGITFALTPEIEKELETTGADDTLVEAVRLKSPAVKAEAVTPPKVEPSPTPRAPDFLFYQNQANAHFVKGEYDEAVINYNKVIQLNPKETSTYFNRGMAYYNTKFYDLAIADYNRAIELDPKEAAAYFRRGDSYEKLGEVDKAIADYKKVLELDSDNESAKLSLLRLQSEKAKAQPAQPKPQAAPAPVQTSESPQLVNLGALNSLAVDLVRPVYTTFDRQRNIQGLVMVEITLSEEGKVLSAKATSGPATLRTVSEEAARRTKFNAPMLGGKAVRATGYISYNFKAN